MRSLPSVVVVAFAFGTAGACGLLGMPTPLLNSSTSVRRTRRPTTPCCCHPPESFLVCVLWTLDGGDAAHIRIRSRKGSPSAVDRDRTLLPGPRSATDGERAAGIPRPVSRPPTVSGMSATTRLVRCGGRRDEGMPDYTVRIVDGRPPTTHVSFSARGSHGHSDSADRP